MRGWRNRQTRWIQVPVPERAWGFNSPLAHREKPTKRVSTSDESPGGARFSLVGIASARGRCVRGGFYVNEPTP